MEYSHRLVFDDFGAFSTYVLLEEMNVNPKHELFLPLYWKLFAVHLPVIVLQGFGLSSKLQTGLGENVQEFAANWLAYSYILLYKSFYKDDKMFFIGLVLLNPYQ